MTVCIAALCNGGLVWAADQMMSWGSSVTSDTSLKFDRLHTRWIAMLAGDDTMPAEAILRAVKTALDEYETPTLDQVEAVIRNGWRRIKNQIAATHVLSPYDIDMETFLHEGREVFGEMGFAELRARIERASELPCELLFAGFDENDKGALLHAVHPGEPVNFARLGFAAIGSGRDSAIASLMWEPAHKSYHDERDAIYRVAAAKFMAESAQGVGKTCIIGGIKPDGQVFILPTDHVAKVRSVWENHGRPRIPKASQLTPIEAPRWMSSRLPSTEAVQPVLPATTHDPQGEPPSQG